MLFSVICWLILAAVVAIPVLAYRRGKRRYGREWGWYERVALSDGGAYRGGSMLVAREPGIPKAIRHTAAVSVFAIVPAIVSVPMMAMGIFSGFGPAIVFGPAGFALALGIFRAGSRLLRRDHSAADRAQSVAIWSIVHNVVLVVSIALVTIAHPSDRSAWAIFSLGELGWVPLGYAIVSFVHAGFLLRAGELHRIATEVVGAKREEAEVPMGAPA